MLEIRNADINYGKGAIVQDVSFHVGDGEKIVILGRNGVGKTTLLKGLIGVLPLSKGTLQVDETDLTKSKPHVRVKAGIAYVPQGREILPDFTVRENIELGFLGDVRKDKNLEASVERVLDYFPILKDHLNRKGGVLSGGQQQQLAIARALMSNPKYLLLDEPTEGIQPNIVSEMANILNRIADEMQVSIILVEQNINFAFKIAEKYMILHKGEVVESGLASDISDETIHKYLSV
ncbi:MAG: urea ABC transporter ATP-binding subunit UrtE [Lachnospiraceae bacterium]|nr:urea ABC transporter ATP-binding subunit UrtE [Lachnospiraceae bacterium]